MFYAAPILLLAAFLAPYFSISRDLPCAIKFGTGISCPGCFMTESVSLALHGRIGDSFIVHPLGPVLVLWLMIVWTAAASIKIANRGAGYEAVSRRLCSFSRVSSVVFAAMLGVVWIFRLVKII